MADSQPPAGLTLRSFRAACAAAAGRVQVSGNRGGCWGLSQKDPGPPWRAQRNKARYLCGEQARLREAGRTGVTAGLRGAALLRPPPCTFAVAGSSSPPSRRQMWRGVAASRPALLPSRSRASSCRSGREEGPAAGGNGARGSGARAGAVAGWDAHAMCQAGAAKAVGDGRGLYQKGCWGARLPLMSPCRQAPALSGPRRGNRCREVPAADPEGAGPAGNTGTL